MRHSYDLNITGLLISENFPNMKGEEEDFEEFSSSLPQLPCPLDMMKAKQISAFRSKVRYLFMEMQLF